MVVAASNEILRAKCAVHPELTARPEPCTSCGVAGCAACIPAANAGVCVACAERAVGPSGASPGLALAPRLIGVAVFLAGGGFITLNRMVIAGTGRTYLILFPLGGMFLGLGLAMALTGRAVLDGPTVTPTTRIVAYICIGLGTLFGVGLNFTG